MKRFYTAPEIEITHFHTEDIITASSNTSGGGTGGTTGGDISTQSFAQALVPPVQDAGDIFYS